MKRILISNDDGYMAAGLECLAAHLARTAEVTVVAPDRDRSGASNSLTLLRPLRVTRAANGFFFVDGTPTDCVHIAITGLLEREPDIVIAGINHGGNLGDDVLYSGTVAAAMEGRFLGLPAIAVSLASPNPVHFTTAAMVVERLLAALSPESVPADTVLNVNVPDVAFAGLRGFEATRLGHRHKAEPVMPGRDPRGRPIYWVGPPGDADDAGEGTDFHALAAGYVSVTPIHADLTRHSVLASLQAWCRERL
ncbi:5'/3'-nucleotidase SurE [Acidiferrobacter sp.]|uniref:5'/3'-nucleotidase SurE n=1 Tax=Acidiferrobacter sp. TaxID=1872107 RepID=UPI002615EC7F|nr:5'/3'-nucleotidase SurE [Acidiferrobacter sp.]